MIYFTSDLHFGHANVIHYDERPFATVQEMDRELIRRWNQKVTDQDTVYILGDISWYHADKTCEILRQLHGRKILVLGNHDRVKGSLRDCFEEVCSYKEIMLPNHIHIVLCHYPIHFFNRRHHANSYMFYGHVHNSREWLMTEGFRHEITRDNTSCNMFNVGCMLYNYEPVSFDEIVRGGIVRANESSC